MHGWTQGGSWIGFDNVGMAYLYFLSSLLMHKLQGLMFSIMWSVAFSVGASLGENNIGFGPILEWF